MIKGGQVLYALVATSVLTLSSLPALSDPRDDDYPFSTYPMFGSRRKTPTFNKAQGRTERGQWQPIPPQLFGTNEVMQAVMTVQRAARTTREARKLCNELLDAGQGTYAAARIVQVTYDPVKYFTEGPHPQKSKVLVQCGDKAHKPKTGRKGHHGP